MNGSTAGKRLILTPFIPESRCIDAKAIPDSVRPFVHRQSTDFGTDALLLKLGYFVLGRFSCHSKYNVNR